MADVHHLIKSLKNALLNHKEIIISEEFVKYFGLQLVSNKIQLAVIEELIEYDQKNEKKVAGHLKESYLSKGHFSKMAVGPALKILSRETGTVIEYLVATQQWSPEALPTAVFCQVVGRWMEIMSCNFEEIAFSLHDVEKYEEQIQFLEMAANFICSLKFGNQRAWKPFQKGVALSTKSVMWLAEEFLKNSENKLDYYLPGRASGNPVESLHSEVRALNKYPTPLNYQRYMRVICIKTALTKPPKGFSYTFDNSEFFTDLKSIKEIQHLIPDLKPPELTEVVEDDNYFINAEIEELDEVEAASLANLVGYVLKKTIKGPSLCKTCQEFYIQQPGEEEQKANQLIIYKEYTEGSLVQPSKVANEIFQKIEILFVTNREIYEASSSMIDKLTFEINEIIETEYDVPSCHIELLIRRFIKIRLHKWAQFKTEYYYEEYKGIIHDESMASRSTRSMTAEQLQ